MQLSSVLLRPRVISRAGFDFSLLTINFVTGKLPVKYFRL